MSYFDQRSENPIVPPVILNLLIINGLVFFLQMFFLSATNGLLERIAGLWPLGSNNFYSDVAFYPWQLLTYGFLHGGFAHILFNMLALWMFGREIEIRWGSQRFLTFYLICIIGAGLAQLVVGSLTVASGGQPYPTVGASGGTLGILLAFGMLFPYRQILMIPIPFPIEARYLVIIYGALTLFAGVTGVASGIAHFAHLGGMLTGLLLILYWRGKLPIQPKNRMFW